MTQDNPLLELRDIHIPSAPSGSSVQLFAPEPFFVLAAVIVLTLAHARWRRSRWRRDARRRLQELEAILSNQHDPERSHEDWWLQLVDLTTDVARRTQAGALPECVFRAPAEVGQAERTKVLGILHKALGTGR